METVEALRWRVRNAEFGMRNAEFDRTEAQMLEVRDLNINNHGGRTRMCTEKGIKKVRRASKNFSCHSVKVRGGK